MRLPSTTDKFSVGGSLIRTSALLFYRRHYFYLRVEADLLYSIYMSTETESSYLSNAVTSAKNVAVEHVGAKVDRFALRAAREKDHLMLETERFIVRNPWRAVGIAAGIGLIAGSLVALSPRSDRRS
jgi:ElaB/YqjD/DUF883 family membrane-anchored ribosome-binding protein